MLTFVLMLMDYHSTFSQFDPTWLYLGTVIIDVAVMETINKVLR